MSVYEKLKELEITLPVPNPAAARYTPAVRSGSLVFTAGQTPKRDGVLQYKGKCGRDLTVEEGKAAARLAILSALAILEQQAGSLDAVERIVKITGFVNSDPDFGGQSQVIDGASELLYELFGERGAHARSAVGCSSLPGNAACEIELIAQIH